MGKKIQLSIAEPCHENWDNMSPTEKGKFCGSCQKQVIDFSGMSDREIAQFFKKPSTGSVCGRFMSTQLDREMELPQKRILWLKYFFGILLPAFFMSKASAQTGKPGKIDIPPGNDTTRQSIRGELKTLGMVLPTHILPVEKCEETLLVNKKDTTPVNIVASIKGRVTDETGAPVPGATVRIKGTFLELSADSNGKFSIPVDKLHDVETLLITSVGFEPVHYVVKKKDELKDELLITMNAVLTGEVVVVAGLVAVSPKPGKKEDKLPELPVVKQQEENNLTVYPNPVRSGSSLSIAWKQKEEGYYSVQVMTLAGRLVQERETWIDKGAKTITMDFPAVTAGSYVLVFTNRKTGKQVSEKVIVE